MTTTTILAVTAMTATITMPMMMWMPMMLLLLMLLLLMLLLPTMMHKWYRIIAEYSEGTSSRALLALARQHLNGRGVPCDVKTAKLWLRRLQQAVPEKSSAYREATTLLKELEDQFV